jgi:hypothetical protein
VQIGAPDTNTRPDMSPHPPQVDLGQEPSTVVENSLMRDARSPRHQGVDQTERGYRTHAVSRQVESRACRPRCRTLDDLCAEPTREKSPAEREATDAGTNDQDLRVIHVPIPEPRTSSKAYTSVRSHLLVSVRRARGFARR